MRSHPPPVPRQAPEKAPTKVARAELQPTLGHRLERVLPKERVLTRPIDIYAYASDASFYRPVPEAVVLPETVEQIQGLFRLCRELGLPLTFRAAGTSLSGQAST